MGDLEKRLRNLEGRTPPPPRARLGHVGGAEIRALEAHIRRRERGEVGAAPVIKSVEPDNETAAVVREIERIERLDHAPEGPRWGT
jgi:hypothetical protein